MRKLFLFLLFISLFFSCKKEIILAKNTELWVKVGAGIDKLELSFVAIDTKNKQHFYDVKYSNGVFNSAIKQVRDNRDGGVWTLVNVSQNQSHEIMVSYNGKTYLTRGFYFGERRFLEIVLTLGGKVIINDNDISITDQEIYVE
jgi:archaellin